MSEGTKLPGLFIAVAIAVAAYAASRIPIPPFTLADGTHPLDPVLLAIALGLAARQVWVPGARFTPGVRFAAKRLLPVAIVLLGAKLDFLDIMRVSGVALAINVGCVALGLSATVWLGKKLQVPPKLALLIGVGTAICGGTAIVVTAPVIEADDHDTAFAVATVTLFGMVAIAAFPAFGHLLALEQGQFGVWAGTGIHATPQVMAAGFAYGQHAGEVAVVVKLVRVLLLAPLVVLMGAWYARTKQQQEHAHVAHRPPWTSLVPPFVIGFLALAVLNSLSLLPDFTLHLQQSPLWTTADVRVDLARLASRVSLALVTVAMAGIALAVDVRGLVRVGMAALQTGLLATVLVASVGLALVWSLL